MEKVRVVQKVSVVRRHYSCETVRAQITQRPNRLKYFFCLFVGYFFLKEQLELSRFHH